MQWLRNSVRDAYLDHLGSNVQPLCRNTVPQYVRPPYSALATSVFQTDVTHVGEIRRHEVGEQYPSSHPAHEQSVDPFLPRGQDFLRSPEAIIRVDVSTRNRQPARHL